MLAYYRNYRYINKLFIYEALSILDRKPDLNRQIDNFINPLKLFSRGTNIPLTRAGSLENVNPLNNNSSDNIPPIHVDIPSDPALRNYRIFLVLYSVVRLLVLYSIYLSIMNLK